MGQNSFHLLSGLITSSSPVAQGGSYWTQRFTYFLTNIFTFFLWPFTPVGLQAINKRTPEHSIPCLCLQLAPGDVQTLDVCLEVSLPGISWLATLSLPLGFPCQGLLDAGFYLLHCKWNNKGITHLSMDQLSSQLSNYYWSLKGGKGTTHKMCCNSYTVHLV